MVRYEVTPTGPKGYPVTAISPEWQGGLVGDFCSEAAAEAFADQMRLIDADPSHAASGCGVSRWQPSISTSPRPERTREADRGHCRSIERVASSVLVCDQIVSLSYIGLPSRAS